MARPKPRGFGSDVLSPVNQEAERIVRGMKRKSAHRFKELYGKRDREVMYATANKLAQKEQLKECDEERKHDKLLLQDLVFENQRKHKLEDKINNDGK